MNYVFCAYRDYSLEIYKKIKTRYKNFVLITNPKQLTFKKIQKIDPKYIFFPDWSWIVPNEIINNYDCICFHESNLPKFRGGSPIQNQIIRGVKKTKTTAFLMTEHLDQGDILLQRNLSLEGTLNNIFSQMIKNDYEIIIKILQGKFKKRKQSGKATYFKRRKPEDSELENLNHSKKFIYDFIRMLSDPYPNAFLKAGDKKMIFKAASFVENKLKIEGEIE
jgi:methionyl-tRNA formyltransferase